MYMLLYSLLRMASQVIWIVLLCFVCLACLLSFPAAPSTFAMQLTPEVVKNLRNDLDSLMTKVDRHTAQIADHAAKLESIAAAIA